MRLVYSTMILLAALLGVADGVGTSSMTQISADGWRKKLKKAAKIAKTASNFVPGPAGMALGGLSNLATAIPGGGGSADPATQQALMTQFAGVPVVGNLAANPQVIAQA